MSTFSSKIDAIIKSESKKLLTEKANKIADDIKEIAKVSIEDWYNAYHPTSYKRTFSTYAAITRVCIVKDDYAIAGVVVNPAMVPDMYHDSSLYVFPRTFFGGIHGTIGTGGITTPPSEILQKNFNTYKSFL